MKKKLKISKTISHNYNHGKPILTKLPQGWKQDEGKPLDDYMSLCLWNKEVEHSK